MPFREPKTQGVQLVSDLLSPSTLDDPYACYAQLRVAGPVHQVAGTNFYLATTWDAVQEAVSRPEDFSSNPTATLVNKGAFEPSTFDMGAVDSAGHVLATGDDPRHAHERKLVLPALVAKRIRALEPAIADIARQLWNDAAAHGHIEWMSAIGDRLPMTLVARLIGLPDADVPELVQLGYGSTELLSAAPQDGERIERVAAQLFGEAAAIPDAFEARSGRSLQRIGGHLSAWAKGGTHADAMKRLQRQLDAVCAKLPAGDSRTLCDGVLKPGSSA